MALAGVNQTTIGYDDTGDGQPLVLLHGLGMDRSMWQPQVERFASTNRVITFDVRGAGESGKLTGGQPVLATQADDLNALLDHLGVQTAVICGVSFGGVLAQEFALRYPERVAGLIISDSFPDARLANLPRRIGLALAIRLAAVTLLLPPAVLIGSIRKVYARWPLARRVVVEGYRTMRRVETARIRLAINRIDNTDRLRSLSCPVLGIVGDESEELIELMRRLVAAVPSARLEVLADSFDPSNLCQPEAFNALVAGFLSDLDR